MLINNSNESEAKPGSGIWTSGNRNVHKRERQYA